MNNKKTKLKNPIKSNPVVYWYKLLNLITAIIYRGLTILSVICWGFTLTNVLNNIWPEFIFRFAGRNDIIGHVTLFIINNTYAKYPIIQNIILFMRYKAFWMAILVSLLLRPAVTLYRMSRRSQYLYYVKKGYIKPQQQQTVVIQQTNNNQNVELANLKTEIAKMNTKLAQKDLEIERMKQNIQTIPKGVQNG